MENNKNYQKILLETLSNLKSSGEKPSLLLHVCCGPCFTIPFEILKYYFKITLIYNNSNIYPENEYHRRLNELKTYIKDINADIEVIEFAVVHDVGVFLRNEFTIDAEGETKAHRTDTF